MTAIRPKSPRRRRAANLAEPPRRRAASVRDPGTSLRVGVASLWLSVIVLLPLAAIAWQSIGGGWEAFWLAVTSHAALESFKVTLLVSVAVTIINLVFGLATAWVLVRDDFVGKGLIDAIIDLPFALPTIVTSLVMLALYGKNSPIGLHLQHTPPGVAMALTFVTLPMVVRAIQPVLLEIDRDVEEAAASLGASGPQVFIHDRAAVVAARAVDGRGPGLLAVHRRVRLGGDDRRAGAGEDRSLVAVDPRPDRKRRPHRRCRDIHCAAVYLVHGAGALADRGRAQSQPGGEGGMTPSPWVRFLTRYTVLAYIGIMLIVPASLILWRTFRPGFHQFYAWVTTPAAISALDLSLLVVAIVVPLNVVFGVLMSTLLARNRFRGRALLQAVIDLPFAVSPIIVGVALILLWGSAGALGFIENNLGFRIIFGVPGIVLASIFVTLPFVVREVQPVLVEVGTEQEQAAATLGSGSWQTFWRITLPSIRWGLTYGLVLTTARTLGEFGGVIMVSSNLPGESQTLTLLVNDRYNRGAEYGAYALSTLMMAVAVTFLIVKTILLIRRKRAKAQA